MTVLTLAGKPQIDVTLRRSARARRMTLRVSRLDGRVTLTLPRGVAEREAQVFANERADWIRKHLSQHVGQTQVTLGMQVPILGDLRRVEPCSGRRVQLEDDVIRVPGKPEQVGRKLEAWLKATARSELAFASDRYSEKLGVGYNKLTIRDTRSRWGSCTSDGGLMYSWRLIMAPAEVLSYVAAHEVAHLREMNHSSAFWSLVEQIYGDYKPEKKWLRTDGHVLHGYKF